MSRFMPLTSKVTWGQCTNQEVVTRTLCTSTSIKVTFPTSKTLQSLPKNFSFCVTNKNVKTRRGMSIRGLFIDYQKPSLRNCLISELIVKIGSILGSSCMILKLSYTGFKIKDQKRSNGPRNICPLVCPSVVMSRGSRNLTVW